MQLLGKLMMAIAVAVAGLSVAMGLTGVGVVSAISVGGIAVGLFSKGASLVQNAKKEEDNLVNTFTSTNNSVSL